ncbi:MAG TPA: hypothetical protein DCG75_01900 [Bacteroidales bacterium]|nr:hypothetical protein [Bacteroidales bacterium]
MNSNYISLDTCTWIYIVNGTEPVSHLMFIKEGLENGKIKLILPRMVIKEWNKHKNETVKKGTLKFFKDTINSLKRLSKLIGVESKEPFWSFLVENGKKEDYFKDLLDKFQQKQQQIEDAVKTNIETVDEIFKHKNTIVLEESDNIKLQASELALAKKAPFIKKNSFADAVILLSFITYVKQKRIEGAKFISYNTEDFCEKENGKKPLHPDLKPFFDDTKSEFYKIVGEALNSIQENIVSEETIQLIKERQEEIFDEDYNCEECDGNRDGYGNIVSFWYDTEIDNEYDGTHENHKYNVALTGNCEWCNSLHIKCPKCESVTALSEYHFDEKVECEGGCGLIFYVDTSDDTDYTGERTIKIIDHRIEKCAECGKDFIDVNKIEICDECEKSHNEE